MNAIARTAAAVLFAVLPIRAAAADAVTLDALKGVWKGSTGGGAEVTATFDGTDRAKFLYVSARGSKEWDMALRIAGDAVAYSSGPSATSSWDGKLKAAAPGELSGEYSYVAGGKVYPSTLKLKKAD